MSNTFRFIALASVFFCVFLSAAKAEDLSFSYPVSTDYELVFTLKNAEKTAVNNGVRYYRGGKPSLDASVNSSAVSADKYYYTTTIEVYDEKLEKVILLKNERDSFLLPEFIELPKNITIAVLIEHWMERYYGTIHIGPDIFLSSNQFSIKYHEDTSVPVVAVSHNGKLVEDGLYANQSPIELIGSAVDEGAGVDEETWISRFEFATVDGNLFSTPGTTSRQSVIFQVRDRLGNTGSKTVWVGLDQLAPVISIERSPSVEWTRDSGFNLTASASDNWTGVDSNAWRYSTDGGTIWSAEGTTRQLTLTNEGRHDVRFKVKDRAGNIGVASIISGIDRTPPVIEIKGNPGDAWIATPKRSLRITASDTLSGMASLEYSLNASGRSRLSSFDTSFDVTGEGKQTVNFLAKDNVGNTRSVTVNVNIDTQQPVYGLYSSFAYQEGNGWVIPVYVSGLFDRTSGVEYASFKYALDGGAWTKVPGAPSGSDFSFLINAASLSAGSHTIKMIGADKAGNVTEQTCNFIADITPPVITGGSLLSGTVDGAPWTNQDSITYAVTDPETSLMSYAVTVSAMLANGYFSPFSGYSESGTELIFNAAAPDGTYRVLIKATNNARLSGEKIFYCRLDRTPPDISPVTIKSASRSVTIRGTDASSGLNYSNCWSLGITGVSGAAGYVVEFPEGVHEKEFTLKDIAGNSVTKKVTIYVDAKPPAVTMTAGEYGNSKEKTLPVTINITSAILDIINVWCVLDGVQTELVKANWNAVAIPIDSLSEGVHTVYFRARNEAGVSGESASHQFVVDKTPPELTGYELRDAADPEHIIAEGEYISGGTILAKIAGEDWLNNGAGKSPGVIKRYSWAVTRRLSEEPDFSSAGQSAANEFTVQNFFEGLNYLCVRAEDSAGNQSEIFKIPVLQDQSSPGAPVIKSSTHTEAARAEQAGFLSRAEFSFSPAYGMKSGVKAYQWRIEKLYPGNALNAVLVREGETTEIDQEGRGALSIELEDNGEEEFYQALARCVGGNGKEGAWAAYRFRIDSEAPGGLILQTVPLADSSSWINQGDILVRWNKPSDMTGVAEYRHIILEEEESHAAPLEGRDPSSWGKTADTQIRANIRGVGGSKKSGRLRIGISAVDYAGNSKLGQLSMGYDFVSPQFSQGALIISDAEDAMGPGKRIRWGSVLDGESGPDRVVILVSNGDKTSAFTVGPGLTEYVVSPLEENKAFTVVVRAYDQAGNQAELYDVCATGNAALPSVYRIPYLETVNGYEVSGKKRIEGAKISFEDITLQIPEALKFFALVDSNGARVRNPLEKIPLENISGAGGIFEGGRSGGGLYELRSGGFALEASALDFSRGGGLDLENAVYERPALVDGVRQDRRISLGRVNAGNPPLIQFSSGLSAIGVGARIESSLTENNGAAGEGRSGFALTGVDSIFLSDGREWFGGAGISFDRGPLAGMGIRLEDEAGKAPLRNSAMEAGSRDLAALLDISAPQPLSLAMGDSVYRVNKAGIRGNLLDIYEAVLPLPPGYEPAELTLRNITIDTHTKTVRQGPDFSADHIAVTSPGGAVFEGTMIRVDSLGRLLVTGYISSQVYGVYRAEDIPLSGAGIDWESGAEIREFAAEIHGFYVSAQKARVTASGILIPEGKIDIWGGRQTVAGLGLRSDKKDSVWQDGTITETFSGDPGYGAPVQMSGGKISGDGVFVQALIPIGDGIVDSTGAQRWSLPQARLHPNFVMTGSFAGEKALVLAGVPVRAENCSFDEKGLRIGKALVEHIPHLSPETAVFAGMAIDYRGLSVEGKSENKFTFSASGWKILYESLGFDGQGIKGRGSLALPEKLGGFALAFPETRITAEGALVCEGPEGTGEIIRFHGLPVFAEGVGLKLLGGAHVLELASPRLSLKSIDGPDIFFGKTIFDWEGKVLLGEDEKRRIDFTSFNGYRIGLEHCGIDDEGFFLTGILSLQLFGRDIEIPEVSYRLLPDLSLKGIGADTELVYAFGDWSVKGSGIVFDADRIRIGANRVLFREIEFDIGEIPLSPDGRLLQSVVARQDIGVSLFGAGARIAETRFSDDGIEASVVISLPAVLGGESFVFDKVGFKADGNFWVEKKIDKAGFSALGFAFAMEELTLDRLGLRSAKASVTLPESMESVSFTVQDLTISSGGEVGIGGAQVSPFTLWNMRFDLHSFSIAGGEANFQGKIGLPPALPGELSGREIQIRDFRASLAGGITAMDIFLEGDYRVPLSGAWALLFGNVRMSYTDGQPWVSADRTELLFPQEYDAQNVYIDHAKFNPLTGQFVFSEVAFNSEIAMNFGGMEFTLNRLKVDSQFSLEFGGSVRFPDSGLPCFIAGKTAAFNRFEIKSDGTLGAIDVKLEGLEGGVIPGFDGLTLKKGSVSLLKEGAKSLILSIGGSIALDKSMPAGLAGAALKIDAFSYDTAAREIKRLKATTTLPSVSSLGNMFSKLSIGIDWNEAKQTGFLNLGGNLIFPGSFPAFLAGKEAKISNFKIGFDGVIQSFAAKYATEKNKAYDAFGFLQLSDVAIEAALKSGAVQFALAGTVILPAEKFPQGIGGLSAAIAMEFDAASGLKTASAQAKMGTAKLFGSMEVRGGTIGISKPAGKALEISLGGSVALPSFFPEGLRGIALGIGKLTVNTSGEILDVDIGASGMGAKIFGTAELSDGSVTLKKGTGNELLVDVGGSVRLIGSALPEGLKNADLEIRALELSTKDGLRVFDAGVKGETAFSILGGVTITVSSLALSETGISLGASAKLPANYPDGLANAQFLLSAFKLGWNGKLLDIKGGLKSWSMTIVGFAASIDELYFDQDAAGEFWVTLKSCKIQIPKNLGSFGGQYIAIKNAKFSPRDGSFLGDVEVSKIETELAGFRLTLDKPSISISENLLNFSKATLKTPEFLGKTEIALKKITLSAGAGLKLSGGAFKLPAFNVGLFAFNNVKVDFSLSGSQYALEGSGSVVIPGAGNISASLAFATKSDTYPIGLKRAEFSYVAALGGIPLGATGLFVNGIAGGLSYGPPTEVPGITRGLFDAQGPRMKVGLHVGDSKGGSVIDMTPTAWVDISNGTWAFEGRAAVLKGSLNITADTTAGLGDKGFVGQFNVDIKFARGGVTVYVFDKKGNTIMSGEGYVEIGVPKGAIIDLWLVKVPSSSLWLAKLNAAFGKFTNGKTGVKGTAKLPVLGTVGVYMGTGGFDAGSLSSYNIEKPNWSKNIRFFDNSGIDSYDNRDSSGNEDTLYQFFVPPKGENIAAPLSLFHEAYDGNGDIPGSGLDRLIIALEHIDGAPELTVTSPSGIEYREGSEGCETIVEEQGVIMAVLSAEAGIWQLRVQGLEEEAYRLSALGRAAMPRLELEEPSLLPDAAPHRIREAARVRGRTEKGLNSIRVFARESKELPGFDLGSYAVDGEGCFDLTVPVEELGDGEYLIYAELDGPGAELVPAVYAPGKILLDRSDLPMLAPLARVAETDEGILSLRWQNANGGRPAGY